MKRRRVIAFLFYGCISIFLGIPVIFHENTFVPADLIDIKFQYTPREKIIYSHTRMDRVFYSYPIDVFFNREVKKGSIPLWNPYIFSGYPVFADGENAFLYPLKFLFHFFFSPWKAGDLLTIFHIFMAQIFMFIYLEEIGCSFFPALSGGFLFGFNIFSLWQNFFRSGSSAMVWLPFLLLCYKKFLNKRNLLWCGLGGFSFAFIILDYLPYAFYAFLVFIFVTGLEVIEYIKNWKPLWKRNSPLIPFLLITATGFLIVYFYLQAVLELALLSQKQRFLLSDVTGKLFHRGRRALFLSVGLFSPLMMGSENVDFLISSLYFDPFVYYSLFAGVSATFLAALSFLSFFSIYSTAFPLLSFVALLIFLHTPLNALISFIFPWFKGIPPFSAGFMFAFSISLSSSFGFEAILKGVSRKTLLLGIATGFILIFGSGLYGFISYRESFPHEWLTPFNIRFYHPIIVFLLIAGAFFINMKKGIKSILLFLIIFIELYPISFLVYRPIPVSLLQFSDHYSSSLIRNYKYERISGIEPNLSTIFEWHSPEGYEAMIPDYYILGIKGKFRSYYFKENREVGISQITYPFAKILSVKYLIILSPYSRSAIPPDKLEILERKDGMNIYEVKDVLPRAFVVSSSRVVKDWREATELIRNGYDPLNGVLIEEKTFCSGGSGSAEIKKYELEKVVLSVEVNGGCGFLILTDTWYPGWKVYVDGKEEKLLRAYGMVRAVKIEEGRHEVLFLYRPWWLIPGILMSCLGIFFNLCLIGYGIKKGGIIKYEDKCHPEENPLKDAGFDSKIIPFLFFLVVLFVKWIGTINRSYDFARARWHVKAGERYLSSGKYEKALSEIGSTLKDDVVHPESYKLMGILLASKGEKRNSLYYLEKAISFFPTDLESLKMLCQLSSELKIVNKGIFYCEKANKIKIDRTVSIILSSLYLTAGRYREGYEVMEKIVTYYPDDPYVLLLLGVSAVKLGYLKESQEILTHLLNMHNLPEEIKKKAEEVLKSILQSPTSSP